MNNYYGGKQQSLREYLRSRPVPPGIEYCELIGCESMADCAKHCYASRKYAQDDYLQESQTRQHEATARRLAYEAGGVV